MCEMTRVLWAVLVPIVSCGVIGYAVPKERGEPTMHDIVACVQMLSGSKMVSHPDFIKNYSAAKDTRKEKLPIVRLLPIRNGTASPVLRTICRQLPH